jgi:hypothetical protein
MSIKGPTYIPRTGSLADRVLDYFRQCPDEELGQADIATKFEVPRGSISACLKAAVDGGSLRYEHNADLEYVYTLGTKPAANAPAPSPVDVLASGGAIGKSNATPKPKTAPLRGRVDLPPALLDFSNLQVERGVPLTGKAYGAAGVSKWAPLFAMLTEPGTSVEFPANWKSAVAAQSTKLNVAHKKAGEPNEYKVRITDNGKARIWRMA